MIKLSKEYLKTLNLYGGSPHLTNSYLSLHFPVFSILFTLNNKTVHISDLVAFKHWYLIKENLKKKDIQPIIDKYYKTYNNLKAFY